MPGGVLATGHRGGNDGMQRLRRRCADLTGCAGVVPSASTHPQAGQAAAATSRAGRIFLGTWVHRLNHADIARCASTEATALVLAVGIAPASAGIASVLAGLQPSRLCFATEHLTQRHRRSATNYALQHVSPEHGHLLSCAHTWPQSCNQRKHSGYSTVNAMMKGGIGRGARTVMELLR